MNFEKLKDIYKYSKTCTITFSRDSLFELIENIESIVRNAQIESEINEAYYQENQKYKEEKRLILKDIKEWISCAKNEKLEGDYTHKQYWDMFETILRKTFNKYNTENLTDDDLKYNHYLEKENNELILENQKYKEVIDNLKDKLMEYFEVGRDSYFYVLTRDKSAFDYGTMSFDDFIEFSEEQVDDIVDFLKEVEHE